MLEKDLQVNTNNISSITETIKNINKYLMLR